MDFRKLYFVVFACVLFGTVQAKQIPAFEKGERAVFVGNSITHGGHYHSYIWLYYMTRFPEKPITIINSGIGGETAWDIKERLEGDIFDRKPTYLALTFGMNDVGYGIYWDKNAAELSAAQVKKSYESYKEFEARMQQAKGVTKVLIGGSPYDETSKMNNNIFHGKNDALLKVNDFQRESAEKNSWGFVDFNRPMLAINQREQQKDSTFALSGPDRIHPDQDGQMVMAYLFLKAQGLAGKKVAGIAVDAEKEKVTVAENCKISGLKKSGNSLQFNYMANALPYPIDTISRNGWGNKNSPQDALKIIPFTKELNQETLKVENLASGVYQLKIDGQPIAEFSANALQAGINMAELNNTPQYQQATQIMVLNEERFVIEKGLREYYWMQYTFFRKKGLLFADNLQALDTLRVYMPKDGFLRYSNQFYSKSRYPEVRKIWQNQMDDIVKTIYEINTPVEHKLEIIKMS